MVCQSGSKYANADDQESGPNDSLTARLVPTFLFWSRMNVTRLWGLKSLSASFSCIPVFSDVFWSFRQSLGISGDRSFISAIDWRKIAAFGYGLVQPATLAGFSVAVPSCKTGARVVMPTGGELTQS